MSLLPDNQNLPNVYDLGFDTNLVKPKPTSRIGNMDSPPQLGNIITDGVPQQLVIPPPGPGGSNTYVQYNDSGLFGGDFGLTWDKTTKILTLTSADLNTLIIDPFIDQPSITSSVSISIISGSASIPAALELPGYDINLFSGSGDNTNFGNGGAINIQSGDSGTSVVAVGGAIALTAGFSKNGIGGSISIVAGDSDNGNGGALTLAGGLGGDVGGGTGGEVSITGGRGGTPGNAGGLTLSGGQARSGNTNGGDVLIRAGSKNAAGTNGRILFRIGNAFSPSSDTSFSAILSLASIATSDKTFTLQNFTSTITGQSVAALTSTRVPFADANGLLTDSANLVFASPALTIGVAGAATGALKMTGATSGTVTATVAAAAGTWTLTLPTSGGTTKQFLQTDGSGVTAWAYGARGQALFDHFVDAGNGTTVETDLYSDTIAASQLANNGEKLEIEYGGVFVSSGTATREIKIYFGGTVIFDTGTLTLSLSSAWTVYVEIIRVSATVIRYMASLTTQGAALSAYTAVGEVTGLTLSNTNIMKITGQAAGVGAATNDIVAKLGYVEWKSAV